MPGTTQVMMEVCLLAAVHKDGFAVGPSSCLPDWHATRGGTIVASRRVLDGLTLPTDGRRVVTTDDEGWKHQLEGKVFVIGGPCAYIDMMQDAQHVVLRVLEGVGSGTSFPMHWLERFRLVEASDDGVFRYERVHHKHPEYVYLDLLRDIVNNGEARDDRTGTGTLALFARQLRFDVSEHLPLLTTKAVPWRLVADELLWFLRGETDANRLKSRIWDANTSREFLDARGLANYEVGDIGSMYGFVWRHCGAVYRGCGQSYEGEGIDQLEDVVRLLRDDPSSRRIVMTTHDVRALDGGVLHPCHGLVTQFYADNRRRLSCHMYQRSMDTFLGGPWNIASYTMLLHIIAARAGMVPHELVISTGDTHVYKDHIAQARKQLARHPLPFPRLQLHPSVATKPIEDITVDDIRVMGYLHHAPLRATMSA